MPAVLDGEGLFLLDRGEPLTRDVFDELLEAGRPFPVKLDYRFQPPPIEELDRAELVPATRADLLPGTLVLRAVPGGFELARVRRGEDQDLGRERVARVLRLDRPGATIRLDGVRWRLLGRLLVGVAGFPRAYAVWHTLATFARKLCRPLPAPLGLGPADALVRGVIEKYDDPDEVRHHARTASRGLEAWEEHVLGSVVVPGARVLVVGSGAGRETVGLARKGVSVTGIDFAPGTVEAARRRAEALGVKATFHATTAGALATACPASFDVVFCACSVYEQTPTRRRRVALLHDLARLMAPGAVLVLAVGWYHDRTGRLALLDGLRWLARRVLGPRFETEPGDRLIEHLSLVSDPTVRCFYHVFQGPAEIEAEIAEAGFRGPRDPEGAWILRPA